MALIAKDDWEYSLDAKQQQINLKKNKKKNNNSNNNNNNNKLFKINNPVKSKTYV